MLVSYQDLLYGEKRDDLYDIVPLTKDEYDAKKAGEKTVIYNNMYMPRLYLQVTGRCNFNCLHCFAAKDNSPLASELSIDQINKLIAMAIDCGICAVSITGGEPTVHPYIREIIRNFAENKINILHFITNGYLLTQDILDLFKALNQSPIIKISFDGIGVHDEMRNFPGAQAAALKALKLCSENGFETVAQVQVNKKTIDSIPDTLRVLDEIGISEAKLIKTTATPRWEINSDGNDFSFKEYAQLCFRIAQEYSKENHKMALNMWQLTYYNPTLSNPKYDFPAQRVRHSFEDAQKRLICPAFEKTIYVGSDGSVYPCLQMQGIANKLNMHFGNVFEDGLHAILQKDSNYFKMKSCSVQEKIEHNNKCQNCSYNSLCTLGCPTLAVLYHGDMMAIDDSICEFYESGIYKQVLELAESF